MTGGTLEYRGSHHSENDKLTNSTSADVLKLRLRRQHHTVIESILSYNAAGTGMLNYLLNKRDITSLVGFSPLYILISIKDILNLLTKYVIQVTSNINIT